MQPPLVAVDNRIVVCGSHAQPRPPYPDADVCRVAGGDYRRGGVETSGAGMSWFNTAQEVVTWVLLACLLVGYMLPRG